MLEGTSSTRQWQHAQCRWRPLELAPSGGNQADQRHTHQGAGRGDRVACGGDIRHVQLLRAAAGAAQGHLVAYPEGRVVVRPADQVHRRHHETDRLPGRLQLLSSAARQLMCSELQISGYSAG